jgi:hypothetical protein
LWFAPLNDKTARFSYAFKVGGLFIDSNCLGDAGDSAGGVSSSNAGGLQSWFKKSVSLGNIIDAYLQSRGKGRDLEILQMRGNFSGIWGDRR